MQRLKQLQRLMPVQRLNHLQHPQEQLGAKERSMNECAQALRIFIEPDVFAIPAKVLAYSILRRTDARIETTRLDGAEWQICAGGKTVPPALRRWLIPERCGWQGRAIYLDARQCVLADLCELWTKLYVLPTARTPTAWLPYVDDNPVPCLMAIDCSRAMREWGWHVGQVLESFRGIAENEGKQLSPERLTAMITRFNGCYWMQPQPARLQAEWHCVGSALGAKVLRFSALPWLVEVEKTPVRNSSAYMWSMELIYALRESYVTNDEVIDAAVAGHMHHSYLGFTPIAKSQNTEVLVKELREEAAAVGAGNNA